MEPLAPTMSPASVQLLRFCITTPAEGKHTLSLDTRQTRLLNIEKKGLQYKLYTYRELIAQPALVDVELDHTSLILKEGDRT